MAGALDGRSTDKGGVTRGSVTEQLKAIKNEPGSDDERDALKHCRTLIEAESEASKDIKEAQAHLDQNVIARYAAVTRASILGLSGGLFSAAARPGQRPATLFGANVALENRD